MNARKVSIKTERLLIRSLEDKDAENYSRLGVEYYSTGKINTPKKARAYFKKVRKSKDEFTFGIFLKEDNRMIGTIDLDHMRWFDFKAGEVSYRIHELHRGNGYATEAVKGLVGYCFNKMRLHKVYADTDPDNRSSQNVLEKCGFKLEGRIRDRRMIKGKWIDELDYGLLRREWNK